MIVYGLIRIRIFLVQQELSLKILIRINLYTIIARLHECVFTNFVLLFSNKAINQTFNYMFLNFNLNILFASLLISFYIILILLSYYIETFSFLCKKTCVSRKEMIQRSLYNFQNNIDQMELLIT